MRATLTVNDNLAEALNRSARLSGRSFKEVVNAAIRSGLATGDHPADAGTEAFMVQPRLVG